MTTKTRFKCGKTKPVSEFYAHPQTADGYLNKCKECARRDRADHEKNNPEAILATRLAVCEKNPSKYNAHKAVEAAVNAGALVRPSRCFGCGCDDTEHRIEAHHHDYSKPLDVIWLCTPCHRRMDAQRREHEGKKPYARRRD